MVKGVSIDASHASYGWFPQKYKGPQNDTSNIIEIAKG